MPDETPILTPADFASLQNTMLSGQVLSLMQAQQKEDADAAAARTRQAEQAAGSAEQTYGQAAAQPAPQVAPNEDFLNSLTGGIASVLQGTQAPAQRAAQRTSETRAGLLRARLENLQALRDNWQTKAQIAERVGDNEMQIKAREKFETLSKTFDLVQTEEKAARDTETERTKQENAVKLEAMKGDIARDVARTRAAGILGALGLNLTPEQMKGLGATVKEPGALPDPLGDVARALQNNQMKFADVPTMLRVPVAHYMAEKQMTILPEKVRNTLNDLSAARAILGQFKELVDAVNTAPGGEGMGPDLASRVKQWAMSNLRGVTQQTSEDAVYDRIKKGLLAPISRSTGERGVLTDRDVERAAQLIPGRSDLAPTAKDLLGRFETFLQEKEQSAIGAYTGSSEDIKGRVSGAAADTTGIRYRRNPQTGKLEAIGGP